MLRFIAHDNTSRGAATLGPRHVLTPHLGAAHIPKSAAPTSPHWEPGTRCSWPVGCVELDGFRALPGTTWRGLSTGPRWIYSSLPDSWAQSHRLFPPSND